MLDELDSDLKSDYYSSRSSEFDPEEAWHDLKADPQTAQVG